MNRKSATLDFIARISHLCFGERATKLFRDLHPAKAVIFLSGCRYSSDFFQLSGENVTEVNLFYFSELLKPRLVASKQE